MFVDAFSIFRLSFHDACIPAMPLMEFYGTTVVEGLFSSVSHVCSCSEIIFKFTMLYLDGDNCKRVLKQFFWPHDLNIWQGVVSTTKRTWTRSSLSITMDIK